MLDTNLGHYALIAKIGCGAMGEVYMARDTRVTKRDVAIKVIRKDAAGAPARVKLFEREAQAISSLNHPNICTLYDFGDQDGTPYMVMELLQGETLAKRLNRGVIEVEEVLIYGMQIASALEHAHGKGIIHRDLKPANIFLTKCGAKVVDFGLAKDRSATSADQTVTLVTYTGLHAGTPPYMSPERWEGKEADERSDLFSFGAVLYEMLTGRKAFEGQDEDGLRTAIQNPKPQPISNYRRIPALLDRIVRDCLEKDPDDRWHRAHDIRLCLRGLADVRRMRQ
jgi:serine/threonine protein kinase